MLLWIAALVAMFVVSRAVGGWTGYGLTLLALALGAWRLDRQLGPVHDGMRHYRS